MVSVSVLLIGSSNLLYWKCSSSSRGYLSSLAVLMFFSRAAGAAALVAKIMMAWACILLQRRSPPQMNIMSGSTWKVHCIRLESWKSLGGEGCRKRRKVQAPLARNRKGISVFFSPIIHHLRGIPCPERVEALRL